MIILDHKGAYIEIEDNRIVRIKAYGVTWTEKGKNDYPGMLKNMAFDYPELYKKAETLVKLPPQKETAHEHVVSICNRLKEEIEEKSKDLEEMKDTLEYWKRLL
jgi:hypothetical protein